MDKTELRRTMRSRKALISDAEHLSAPKRVFATLRSMPAFVAAKNVLLYNSLPDELSTKEFLANPPHDKLYYLPRVNGLDLDILPYHPNKLHTGAYNIEEPDGDQTIDIDQIDLIIVPAVAFDHAGNRLGRGKGFYDRLLQRSCATTIGICYNCQLVDTIPTDTFDIPVDYVIADNFGIIRSNRKKQ